MKSANFLVIFLLLVFNAFGIETGIKGIVKDQISGEPLAGAHLVITKYNLSTISSDDGTFYFTGPFEGDVKIECSYLGYQPAKQNISVLKDQLVAIEISLQPTIYSSNEVVITASRSTDGIKQIPARINVITRAEIENSPHEAVEDILKYSAGINVLSPGGIYSIRPVITLRGLGGDEQGRTLILVDGIPLNKGDTGGVNWARLNSEDIERIEVFHGPGSSIYGNNAMGGVINIITRKPTQKIEGSTRLSYGTYNTLLSSAHIGGYYKNGMYFRLSGMYNTSDGYNDKPDELREDPDYSVPRFFDEYNISTKAGWNLNPFFNVEFQYDHYRNKKSDGEKIEAPDGEYRRFDTDFLSAKLQGSTGKFSYSLHTFFQHEEYFKLDERISKGSYSRFDVMSDRIDKGMILNLTNTFSTTNKLVYGAESRFGSVDGGDYYQTSADSVVNKGKLDTYAVFFQDEQKFLHDKLIVTAGLRYDNARFHDGDYLTTDGSWQGVLPDLEDHNWDAISPRIGVGFQLNKNNRIYTSWSRGFRASILDDLCRSGWMWVGPKIANPELGPETIDNIEIGGDFLVAEKIKIAPAIYAAHGRDFLYYVATGDSLWGRSPIFQRQNITEVDIYGFEIQSEMPVNKEVNIFLNYNFNYSSIGKFEKKPELEGKMLTYTPQHQIKAGVIWNHPFFTLSLSSIYKSKQFTSDDNSKYIDPCLTFDGKISKSFAQKFTAYAEVLDILDNQHYDSELYLSPGRRVNIGISYHFN